MAELTPDKIVQKIRETGFQEDLDVIPEQAKTFWMDNIIIRTLTRLVAKGRTKYIPIRATEAGALLVADTGGATDVYEAFPKTAITDAVQTKTFTQVISRLDITTWDFNVIITLSYDGVSYGADIVINANTFYSIEHSVKAVKHKNGTPGSNATLQLVGFY